MKTKKIQKKLREEHRRAMHERVGAIILALTTLVGMVTVEHQSRNYQKEATARTTYSFSNNNNSGRENETTRMPVKYDDVLRWQTSSGS